VTRIDLVTLSLFIAVAEESSLARAAEREHLAPSAISKRLADMELALNVRLFERRPTGMLPTAAGAALLHHARLIMRNVASLEADLSDFAGGIRGTIRVHANATAIVRYLPEDLRHFLALFPHVRVDLEESVSPATLQAVSDNVAEIGIYGDVVVPAHLNSTLYRRDRLALLVPHGHELAERGATRFADAAAYEFIGAPRGSSIETAMLRAAADLGVPLKTSIRISGFDAISRMVDAGLGIAIVPESVASVYCETLRVRLLRLEETWARRRLMICTRDREFLTPAAAALVAHLTAGAAEASTITSGEALFCAGASASKI
jgi:DNA-binding transcriptional LysR family regulator